MLLEIDEVRHFRSGRTILYRKSKRLLERIDIVVDCTFWRTRWLLQANITARSDIEKDIQNIKRTIFRPDANSLLIDDVLPEKLTLDECFDTIVPSLESFGPTFSSMIAISLDGSGLGL
jgi:hypothetical protein